MRKLHCREFTGKRDRGGSIARYRCSAMVREEQVSIKLRSRKIAAQSAYGCKRLSHKGFNSPVWVGPTDIRYVYSDAETSRLNRRTKEKSLDLTLICYKQRSYIILLERVFTSRMPICIKMEWTFRKETPLHHNEHIQSRLQINGKLYHFRNAKLDICSIIYLYQINNVTNKKSLGKWKLNDHSQLNDDHQTVSSNYFKYVTKVM